MKLSKLSAAILTALASTASTQALAENTSATLLNSIYVSSSPVLTDNLQTAYATETYSKQQIKDSGANSITDFLSQNTTLEIQPYYGNPLSPVINLNGFGIANGNQNIQMIVDGVSINNIDSAPQLLSSINLGSVEEITIIKGSGSVLYGDGATAGAIIINTNNHFSTNESASIRQTYGSYDTSHQSLQVKKTTKQGAYTFLGAIQAEAFHTNGSKQINTDGTRNSIDTNNLSGTFGVQKNKTSATLVLSKNNSKVNYPGSMTLADFNADAGSDQTGSNSGQRFDQVTKRLTVKTAVTDSTQLSYTFNTLDKNSTFASGWASDYVTNGHKIDLKTKLSQAVFQYGVSKTDAYRDGSTNRTTKDNQALYGLVDVALSDSISVNAGYRLQDVDYRYKDASKDNRQENNGLTAYNLGLNYLLNQKSALYANLNRAFQAPNIDSFFSYGDFNAFIKPMETDTITLGYKRNSADLTIKAELFYIDLSNEIYYDPTLGAWGTNTNIDESHKQGANFSIHKTAGILSTGLDYAYVQAKIDKEAGTSYAGKTLPGSSENTLKLFAQLDFSSDLTPSLPDHLVRISHKQTSDTYAMSDWTNDHGKFKGYQSTDISYSLSNQNLSIQLGINNLLDESNGLYLVSGGAVKVYPTTFERYYYVSANYQF